MSDPTFTSVTISQATGAARADLLTIDTVDGADGNGGALRFLNNSAGGLSLALGRLGASRVDASTVRLELGITADPSLSSGDSTPALLSLEKGAGAPSIVTTAGSLLDVGGALAVSGAASLTSLAVSGATTLNGGLAVTGATTLNTGLAVTGDMSLSGTLNGRTVAADGASLDAHMANTANPHNTTAAQVGALALTGGTVGGSLTISGGLRVAGDYEWPSPRNFLMQSDGPGEWSFDFQNNNPASVWSVWGPSVGQVLAVRNNGRVGINIADPHITLHVNGWAKIGGVGSDYLQLEAGGGNTDRATFRFDTNYLSFWNPSIGDFMFLRRNGRVGLGLADPRTPLHVRGGIATGLDFNSAGSVTFYPPDGFAWFHIDNGPAGGRPQGRLRFSHGGTPGQFELMSINQSGDVTINGRLIAPRKVGFVTDQFVNNLGAPLEQGDVVVIGADQESLYYPHDDLVPAPEVDLAASPYDSRLCGIVVEAHIAGKRSAADGEQAEGATTEPEVFTTGRATVEPGQIGLMVTLGAFAHCKVDADVAPISPGDLLTTSATPGHAQKVLDRAAAVGAILGKALAGLERGKGKIPVLVMLQ